MVDGYLGKLTTEHRMLIHLFDNILPSNQWEAPVALTQAGISAQLIITTLEGNISRYIRSKFKDSPSTYVENVWSLISISIFKD